MIKYLVKAFSEDQYHVVILINFHFNSVHVVYMWRHAVYLMWPTCVVSISHVYPHVETISHMWSTCEVKQAHVDIVCPTYDAHEPTCGYMWGSFGFLSLNITLTCEFNVWNWNNTKSTCEFHMIFRKDSAGFSNSLSCEDRLIFITVLLEHFVSRWNHHAELGNIRKKI